MRNRKTGSGRRGDSLIESLELRLLMFAGDIVVNTQANAPLQLFSQTGTLLATSSNYPSQSSTGAGDGGSALAMVVDKNDNLQVTTGVFSPFLQRYNGQISGGGGWTTEQTTIEVPGWSSVNRTFYGGLATVGNYVFATDMSTGSGGGANGLIRFDASNNYAATRFADGTDYNNVTLGMDGNIYAMVSPPGQPSSGAVNVYNPNTLALIRTIGLSDTDDAAVVADAQGNIYTGAFDGSTRKISPAGVLLASVPIASTDLQISTDGKILSCAGGTIRVLDENLNILSGFNVASPYGAVFACWNTYQAPGATTATTTVVTAGSGSASFGQPVTLTAAVASVFGNGPTGSVQFTDGGTDLGGPVAVNSSTGSASFSTSALAVGTHSITAVYSGDSNFTTSASPALALVVAKATPTLSIVDAGGVYTGAAFPAAVTVNGSSKLENVSPTVAYFAGTTATGTPLGAAPSTGGTYTALATFPGNADYASAISNPVTFSIVTLPAAPTITAQPTQQSAVEGQSVDFIASADGSPVPTVQWRLSSDGGATYSDIAGATSTTYSFVAALGETGYRYEAVFTNSQGSATTNAAMLTVTSAPAAPTVTNEPEDQTVPTGQPGAFTSAASGNPTPAVQWQISTDGGSSYRNISGATSTTYSFTAAAGQDGDLFRAVFTNSHGSATSSSATLTLAPPLTAPAVSSGPADQSALSGNAVSFNFTATANPSPTVQWQASSDGTTFTDIPGAMSATLSFTPTLDQNDTRYRAVLTNSQGSATTSAATLSVSPTQFVQSTPPPDNIAAGQEFGFAAVVTDASGNVDPGFTGNATVSLPAGSSATLGGQLTVPVTDGVATFSGLTLDSVGSFPLVVSSAAAVGASTPAVTVTTPLSKIVPAFGRVSLPATAIIGAKFNGRVSVILNNTGGLQTGVFTVHLFADTTNGLDGNEQSLTTFAKKLSLHADKGKSFSMQIKTLPASLPAGTYHILAEVVDPAGAINVSATTSTFAAAAPFVHLTAMTAAVAPATIAADRSGSTVVTITNTGNETAAGPITITLAPSSDGQSAMSILLETKNGVAKLGANKSKTYRLHFKSTGQLAAGSYFPFVSVSLGDNEATAVGPLKFTIE